jgi:hypothetical protein
MVPRHMQLTARTLFVELHKEDCQLSLVKNLIDQLMLHYLAVQEEEREYMRVLEAERLIEGEAALGSGAAG